MKTRADLCKSPVRDQKWPGSLKKWQGVTASFVACMGNFKIRAQGAEKLDAQSKTTPACLQVQSCHVLFNQG